MSWRPRGALVAGLLIVMVAAACGKKGNPLPPLTPTPPRIADLTAHRIDNRVELQFTVPPANADGSTPAAIGRVEIYRLASAQGAPPVVASQVMADSRNLRAEIRVRPVGSPAADVKTDVAPAPAAGDRASFVDSVDSPQAATVATWSYVVVGVVGRGRRGPVSPVVNVPIATLPPAPATLSVSSTETEFTLSWQPTDPGRSFNVFEVDRAPDAKAPALLAPKPIAASEFTLPVEFGRERCFAVRTVIVAANTTVEGPSSPVACTTAIDRYPPPAPDNLQAIQQGTSITLNWTGVGAADLAGYIVLRGDATGVSLQPLMRQPIRETTFTDATAQPGGTYTYSVCAVDNAPTPNVSQQSNRQLVTVR